ncbi:hypothetical protein E4U35_004938 [Claviceps purpurea]|nr:hypothetical protein E4U27_007373 [Claviceps purpurea]KAG6202799.1 hypothetical protein E4U35_004938 [Claviceps purpurea]KAG6228474.1 hypothetical protein E4U26_000977 [Claviceps purpurea]
MLKLDNGDGRLMTSEQVETDIHSFTSTLGISPPCTERVPAVLLSPRKILIWRPECINKLGFPFHATARALSRIFRAPESLLAFSDQIQWPGITAPSFLLNHPDEYAREIPCAAWVVQ